MKLEQAKTELMVDHETDSCQRYKSEPPGKREKAKNVCLEERSKTAPDSGIFAVEKLEPMYHNFGYTQEDLLALYREMLKEKQKAQPKSAREKSQ